MTYNASNIHILEGLEAVRVRPAMYIGSTNVRGLNHLVYEIVDNSVDEASNGYGDKIHVILNEDGSCTVRDFGRGIPVDLHETGISALRVVLTTLHAGGKFDNDSYRTSGGLHGVGSSVVNALSEWMDVEVFRNGNIYHDRYEYGKPVIELEDGMLPIIGKSDTTGTRITFKPDASIFSTVVFKSSDIKNRIHETAYLNPNLEFTFEDKRPGSEETITFHEPGGILKYLDDMNEQEEKVYEPYSFSGSYEGDHGTIQVEVAFQYIQSLQEKIVGFCNNIGTQEGGTHITAIRTQLTTLINQYARELGKLKDKDSNFTGSDVRSGFTAVVSVKHPNPEFEGQTKTKLDNQDAYRAVASICSTEFQLFFDRNVDVLNKVISIAEKSAKVRISESKARDNIFKTIKKFSFDSNGKLANCSSKDSSKCELFIVEGNSAAGSGKMARNRQYQAILPIRGKILNTEKAPMDRILANVEIRTIIYALNCGFSEGYGNDFDISKLRYDKIILMCDADPDGDHITTLLVTLFYRLMPEIIYEGHLYIAVSPLYRAIPKKGDPVYLYDDEALEEYRKTHTGFHIQRYKGLGEMNPDQLWDTTMNPETRILKQVVIGNEIEAAKTTSDLMGSNAEPRKRFIYERAQTANIDV